MFTDPADRAAAMLEFTLLEREAVSSESKVAAAARHLKKEQRCCQGEKIGSRGISRLQ